MANFKTTIRRDGTVKFWDVRLQQWREMFVLDVVRRGSGILATLPERDRARINETAVKFGAAR